MNENHSFSKERNPKERNSTGYAIGWLYQPKRVRENEWQRIEAGTVMRVRGGKWKGGRWVDGRNYRARGRNREG